MYALIKHPLVDCDVEEAALWYHQHDPAVALRFVDEVRLAMREAAKQPLRFPERFIEVRRIRLHRFPYSVFFRIRADTVQVLAVLHGARDVDTLIQGRSQTG